MIDVWVPFWSCFFEYDNWFAAEITAFPLCKCLYFFVCFFCCCCMISVIFMYWIMNCLKMQYEPALSWKLVYGYTTNSMPSYCSDMQLYFHRCPPLCIVMVMVLWSLMAAFRLLPITMVTFVIFAVYSSDISFLNLLNFLYCSCFDYTNALAVRFFCITLILFIEFFVYSCILCLCVYSFCHSENLVFIYLEGFKLESIKNVIN